MKVQILRLQQAEEKLRFLVGNLLIEYGFTFVDDIYSQSRGWRRFTGDLFSKELKKVWKTLFI